VNAKGAALLLGSLCGVAACGVLEPPVARSVDGVVTEGRFIDPEAYALYAVAALREAHGQWRDALALYQRALDVDSRGPEVRTRIGAVACKLRQNELADRSFAAARRAASDYGPLWFELGLCRKSRGELAGAQSAALEAVRLDPERFEASLLAAAVAEQRGDRALAWQLRDGLATHAPDSVPVQRSLLKAALRDGEAARAARAQATLTRLNERRGSVGSATGIAEAVAALEHGDLRRAKRDAQQLLGADPGNGDALVVALLVADLEQDHAAFDALLANVPETAAPASPHVLSLLAALLGRRVSAQADQLVRRQP
jgi:tetratricopeptide (TPR) repeat protein